MNTNARIPATISTDRQGSSVNWQETLQNSLRTYLSDWEPLFRFLANSQDVGFRTFNDGEWICKAGEAPECFWLIVHGQVDIIGSNGVRFKSRNPGEIVGEQSILMADLPSAKEISRTTGMRAHGRVSVVNFNAALIANSADPKVKAAWYQLLAHLLNDKLIQASKERSAFVDTEIETQNLLRRFCDIEALSLVQMALQGGTRNAPNKDAVVLFSDIAGFSGWAKGRDSDAVGESIRKLMGFQVDLIHKHDGAVDKLMGDGLMGFWFVNSLLPESVCNSVRCAIEIATSFKDVLSRPEFDGLGLRIGLHCGDVCFGDFGTDDRVAVTLIGEPVNLAARYEQLRACDDGTVPGTVRISDTLFQRIEAADSALSTRFTGPKSATVKADKFTAYWAKEDQ